MVSLTEVSLTDEGLVVCEEARLVLKDFQEGPAMVSSYIQGCKRIEHSTLGSSSSRLENNVSVNIYIYIYI